METVTMVIWNYGNTTEPEIEVYSDEAIALHNVILDLLDNEHTLTINYMDNGGIEILYGEGMAQIVTQRIVG